MRFSRLVSLISLIILSALGLVIVSSWATKHAINGGPRFSEKQRDLILDVAELPNNVKTALKVFSGSARQKGVSNIYSNYIAPTNLHKNLSGFLLLSRLAENGASYVSIVNLSNGLSKAINIPKNIDSSGNYSGSLDGSESRRQEATSRQQTFWHPHLSENGGLTYCTPWNDLVSIDINNMQIRWKVRGAFHHSIEVDYNGDLWACGAIQPGSIRGAKNNSKHSNKRFEDQALVKISSTGKILKTISVSDLILNSGLEYVLYGASNPNIILDPLHLNQITPIHEDAGVLKKGFLLVSLRNVSTILLVDPESESIKWYQTGPWMNQHCVLPIGTSEFSVFDNHSFASGDYWLNTNWRTRILNHNMVTGKTEEVEFNKKSPRDFHIPIEGRAQKIGSDLWMIEDCTRGTIMFFQDQNLIFKWSNTYPDGSVGVTSWCRYIPPDRLKNLVF